MCNEKVSILSSTVSKVFHELLIVILFIDLSCQKETNGSKVFPVNSHS